MGILEGVGFVLRIDFGELGRGAILRSQARENGHLPIALNATGSPRKTKTGYMLITTLAQSGLPSEPT